MFAKQKKRGFFTYVRSTIKEFFTYKSHRYVIEVNGETKEMRAMSLTFANCSQFGNHAMISPNSSITDGKMELCIIKPFPKILIPLMGLRLFRSSLPKSKYYKRIPTTAVRIVNTNDKEIHIDGEPEVCNGIPSV